MKRAAFSHVFFATALAGAVLSAPRMRQGTKMDPDAKPMTIEGAVRDLACPVQNPAASPTNFSLKCTMDCVKHGSPIIILTKTGLIYFPISADMPDSDQREKMMPFVGKYVQATGPVFERKGTRAIAITKIKEMKNVHMETDGMDDH
jgi:hypothetical protein